MSEILFQIWGSRGGRNTRGSRIGNLTSCYSLRAGAELFVFDAGRGLVGLAEELLSAAPPQGVERIYVFVTHAHLDHWEGLKDAAWMWRPGNGLELRIFGPDEALDAIHRGHQEPSFVPLEILASNTLARLSFERLAAGETVQLPGASLRALSLHHYSGIAPDRRYLDTLGYLLTLDAGPSLAYLTDHEPTAATRAMEDELLTGSRIAIVDASYGDVAEHAFGHGSIEFVAELARRHPAVRVIAGHHGPTRSDEAIEDSLRRHGAGCPNLAIAVEGHAERWDAARACFTPR